MVGCYVCIDAVYPYKSVCYLLRSYIHCIFLLKQHFVRRKVTGRFVALAFAVYYLKLTIQFITHSDHAGIVKMEYSEKGIQ